ncbi:MAG TPA: hypothetical protein VME46_13790 [Acidimicrobiales bacterium]|nr:hypothetical protein [Acidimicrobiales bacterium]
MLPALFPLADLAAGLVVVARLLPFPLATVVLVATVVLGAGAVVVATLATLGELAPPHAPSATAPNATRAPSKAVREPLISLLGLPVTLARPYA